MNLNRSNIHKFFISVSLVLFGIGFSGLFGPQTTGLGKGFGAIFFVLFMIFNFLKNELTDQERRDRAATPVKFSSRDSRGKINHFRPAKA